MNDPGWTLQDLAGELGEYGLEIENVPIELIERQIHRATPDKAAREVARSLGLTE